MLLIRVSYFFRLRPSTKLHQFSNGSAQIQSDGVVHMEFIKIREVTQYGQRTKVADGNETFDISPDGKKIEISRQNEKRTYSHGQLPTKYWSKYNYACKFVNIVREQTPKITKYSDKAVCRLMENGPEPNFEMTVYSNGAKISYHASKGIKIFWPNNGQVEQYSSQTLKLDKNHVLFNEFQIFLTEKERLSQLEKMHEDFEKNGGGETFPFVIGKRPSSLSS